MQKELRALPRIPSNNTESYTLVHLRRTQTSGIYKRVYKEAMTQEEFHSLIYEFIEADTLMSLGIIKGQRACGQRYLQSYQPEKE